MGNILGIDVGYGDVKVVLANGNGEINYMFKFPSAIASTYVDESNPDHRALKYGNGYYYVGDLALRSPSEKIIDITTYEDLERYSPLFIYQILTMIPATVTIDRIVLGLAMTQAQNSARYQAALSSFKVNDRELNYRVDVIPQGVGAKLSLDYYDHNARKLLIGQKLPDAPKDYFLVDGGFNTLDTLVVLDGIATGRPKGIEGEGIVKIAQKLQKLVMTNFNKVEFSLKEAKTVLENKSLRIRGDNYPLDADIELIVRNYTGDLHKLLESKFGTYMDKVTNAIFVGGVAHYIASEPKAFIQPVKTEPEFRNALGNVAYALNFAS